MRLLAQSSLTIQTLLTQPKKAIYEVDFALDEVDDKLDELEQEGDNQ